MEHLTVTDLMLCIFGIAAGAYFIGNLLHRWFGGE